MLIIPTESLKQVILAYENMIQKEELSLVHTAVQIEMNELHAGRPATHSFKEVKKSIARKL